MDNINTSTGYTHAFLVIYLLNKSKAYIESEFALTGGKPSVQDRARAIEMVSNGFWSFKNRLPETFWPPHVIAKAEFHYKKSSQVDLVDTWC